MTKQIYYATEGMKSLTMPYLPELGLNGTLIPYTPDYFTERYEVPGFELHEVKGHDYTLVDGEWVDLGWVVIWTRSGIPEKENKA